MFILPTVHDKNIFLVFIYINELQITEFHCDSQRRINYKLHKDVYLYKDYFTQTSINYFLNLVMYHEYSMCLILLNKLGRFVQTVSFKIKY